VLEAEFSRFLLQMGVGGILAGLLFVVYRKDVRSYTELWKEQAALNAKMVDTVIALVERNTGTISKNTEVLKSLHARMDRLDILRVVSTDEGLEIGRHQHGNNPRTDRPDR